MKRIILGVLFLGLMNVSHAEMPLSLGIKASYNTSKFTIDNLNTIYYGDARYALGDVKTDFSAGFNLGVFARLQKNRLYFQPEAYVAVRKGNVRMDVESATSMPSNEVDYVTQDIELATLDIPLLVGFRLINAKMLKVSVFTGPSASLVLNEKVNFTPTFLVAQDGVELQGISMGSDVTENFDPEDGFNQANWNWQAGVGLDILNFCLDVRYEMGLNNISTFDLVQKTNMLTFTVGIKLF